MDNVICLGKKQVSIRKVHDRKVFQDEHGLFIKIWGTFQSVKQEGDIYVPIPENEEVWHARKEYKIK
ncbi:hypothetical protein CN918_29160 [Priestia megaterium]|nr:hypothetical protein CN918_29160 [Priestia megaterium]